jgi:hypothetical protein
VAGMAGRLRRISIKDGSGPCKNFTYPCACSPLHVEFSGQGSHLFSPTTVETSLFIRKQQPLKLHDRIQAFCFYNTHRPLPVSKKRKSRRPAPVTRRENFMCRAPGRDDVGTRPLLSADVPGHDRRLTNYRPPAGSGARVFGITS